LAFRVDFRISKYRLNISADLILTMILPAAAFRRRELAVENQYLVKSCRPFTISKGACARLDQDGKAARGHQDAGK
jgi:hypothetical protein